MLVIRDALNGSTRFRDFVRSIGVARNILSARLKTIAQGLLEEIPRNEFCGFKQYVRTDNGGPRSPLSRRCVSGVRSTLLDATSSRTSLVDRTNGEPVAPVRVYARDGTPLTGQHTTIVTDPDAAS